MAKLLQHSVFEDIGPGQAGLVFDFDTGEAFLIRDNASDDFWGVPLSMVEMRALAKSRPETSQQGIPPTAP